MTVPPLPLDDDFTLDSPEHFVVAAEALVGRYTGPFTAHHVAKALSWLAKSGHIVSAAEYDRRCDDYAAQMERVERVADDLAGILSESGAL